MSGRILTNQPEPYDDDDADDADQFLADVLIGDGFDDEDDADEFFDEFDDLDDDDLDEFFDTTQEERP